MAFHYSAINCCDIAPLFANLANLQEASCRHVASAADNRWYLGSYSCPNYLFQANHETIFERITEQRDAKVTLVIPTCNQSNLQIVKQKVSDLVDRYGAWIDEHPCSGKQQQIHQTPYPRGCNRALSGIS